MVIAVRPGSAGCCNHIFVQVIGLVENKLPEVDRSFKKIASTFGHEADFVLGTDSVRSDEKLTALQMASGKISLSVIFGSQVVMQAVHHLFRQLITLLLVLVTVCGLVLWLLLDTQPLLTAQGQLNAESVRNSKQLLSNLNQSIRELKQPTVGVCSRYRRIELSFPARQPDLAWFSWSL